jgi:hypothetical protein
MGRTIIILGVVGPSLVASVRTAVGQAWVGFGEETSTRIVAAPGVGASDPDEKDYAWGDLDGDGDVDLVCVRKQPFDTTGRRRNVLFMNEGVLEGHALNGVLVDRSAQYASASDVDGDLGFLTPTNDRDVKVLDANRDGLLDLIVAATLSDGQPKSISHPRLYINLGADGAGNWLGLRYEEMRIPQLAGNAPSGFPHAPRFNNVAVGDVNGDGAPDLYFADGDFGGPETFDFNNRLLLDADGIFVDVTASALPPRALANGTAVTTGIADLNLDGGADLIRQAVTPPGAGVSAIYNDPGNPGAFGPIVTLNQTAPTDLTIGDLNNDPLPDLVITDDGWDRYLINLGSNDSGFAIFQTLLVSFQSGNDDGFGGESVIADLDNDGFADVIITDVDFDIPGCNRRAHIYRNLGNPPLVTLEEASPSVIPTGALSGTHDVAALDLNGDAWQDLVLGRCTGMRVWMNLPPCRANLTGPGSPGGAGSVDVGDLLALIVAWGSIGGLADIDQDGFVAVGDLVALITAWGECP